MEKHTASYRLQNFPRLFTKIGFKHTLHVEVLSITVQTTTSNSPCQCPYTSAVFASYDPGLLSETLRNSSCMCPLHFFGQLFSISLILSVTCGSGRPIDFFCSPYSAIFTCVPKLLSLLCIHCLCKCNIHCHSCYAVSIAKFLLPSTERICYNKLYEAWPLPSTAGI